jgi:hypothetical protein
MLFERTTARKPRPLSPVGPQTKLSNLRAVAGAASIAKADRFFDRDWAFQKPKKRAKFAIVTVMRGSKKVSVGLL